MVIDYVDLETMKLYSNIDTDQYDDLIEEAIASASREVDRRTDRYFGQDAEVSTREFDCEGDGFLFVDDVSTTTGLLLEGEALPSTYKLFPRNGVVAGLPGFPYTRIKSCAFLEGQTYEVTARWGWYSVPPTVVEVTKMIAAETFFARETPQGVKGMDAFGGVARVRERQHIEKKLKLYTRYPVEIA